MDRALPKSTIYKRRFKYGYLAIFGFLSLIFLLYGFRTVLKKKIYREDLLVATAESGMIEETITAAGIVVPEKELTITSPIDSKIDSVYFNPGDKLIEGAPILLLQKDALLSAYEQQLDEYQLTKNRKEQLRLQLEKSKIDLTGRNTIKEMRIQFLKSNLKKSKDLFELGGYSEKEYRQAQLELEIAEIEHSQLVEQLANERQLLKASLREAELQIKIQKKNIEQLEKQLDLAEVKAPTDATLIWVNDDIGSVIDRGSKLAQVADLTAYRIRCTIADRHAGNIQLGGKVYIKMKQDHTVSGTITNIHPAIDEEGIITFIVKPRIEEFSAFRSNLRVDVFVVLSYKDNVIKVKNGPFYSGLIEQPVFILQGNKAVRRIVTLGMANFDYIEIKDKVKPGEEVIISDTEAFSHLKEFNIETK